MTVRVLIVDDRSVVRHELHSVLEMFADFAVVGEAVDGWDAIRQAEVLRPDLVLMDLEMPGMDGFEATRQIKASHLAQKVVVLTVYGDALSQQKAMEAGADAFMVKGTDLRTLLDFLEKISS